MTLGEITLIFAFAILFIVLSVIVWFFYYQLNIIKKQDSKKPKNEAKEGLI